MKTFAHFNAFTTDEAVSHLRRYGDKAQLIAGGTDLLGKMKDRILSKISLLEKYLNETT